MRIKPATGLLVYALSELDKKWYRGVIEEDRSIRVRKLFDQHYSMSTGDMYRGVHCFK